MPAQSIQSQFLEEVKKRLPVHVAFADEIAEVLSISRDSAYRRIRGETILSLDEVSAICSHFKFPLDGLVSPSSGMVSFHSRFVTEDDFTFEKWLRSIEENIDMIVRSSNGQMVISAKDIPIFYYFNNAGLSAFKMFFWMKSILGYKKYEGENYNPELIPAALLELGKRIHEKFLCLSRMELWSDDTIHASLRQIEFYYDCGFFSSANQAQALCDELSEILIGIRERAASGKSDTNGQPFDLYKNDILIADNTFLFKLGDKRQVFINHNSLNVLTTANEVFCAQTEKYLQHLSNKATKISGTGEKERLRFFNTMEEKIRHLKKKLL